jgi:hypothetical protein
MRSMAILVFGVIWLGVCVAGFWRLFKYESTPGASASRINTLPNRGEIPQQNGKAALVLFAHPQCPCTRTSIDELAQLMAACDGKISASVYFFKPRGFAKDWEKTDLWHSASAIYGVRVLADIDGAVARKFGALTSGQVFLFDEKGNEVFDGGITAGRGHAGDNAGLNSIVAWVNSKSRVLSKTPVFGCSLTGPTTGDRGNAN